MARKFLDFYETPEHYVKELLKDINPDGLFHLGKVFDPCVGDGAISRFFDGCMTNDIDPSREAHLHRDATQLECWEEAGKFDWVITNPPFSRAFEIAQHALKYADNVAMLFRISFLEPTKDREAWLIKHPPTSLIYLPRYSFTQNGKSDSSTCMWAVWESNYHYQSIRIAPRFPK